MKELIDALGQFIARDLMYVVGGCSVSLAFLYLFDALPSSEVPGFVSFVALGVAYATGYAIQEIASLTPFVTTQSIVNPPSIAIRLYNLFTHTKWAEQGIEQDKLEKEREDFNEVYGAKPKEVIYLDYQRIVSLKQVGTTVGSAWVLCGAILLLKFFIQPSWLHIGLTIYFTIFGLALVATGWIKTLQQVAYVHRYGKGA